MPFRADLDLTEILDQVGWNPADGSFRRRPVVREYEDEPVDRQEGPSLQGRWEDAEASTETALVVTPEIIWDTNYYYRVHGFTWPYRGITVRDLRLAHHARGGRDDPYMTMALAALRNAVIRRQYDSQDLGDPYLDRYVKAWLKEQAIRKAADLSREFGVEVDPEKVLQDLGYDLNDDDVSAGQDPSSTPPAELSEGCDTVHIPWTWSYYRLRTSCDDTDRLGRWQELLVEAFAQVGTRRRFCVGFVGRQPHEWISGEVQGRRVFFLSEHVEPTADMAAAAALSTDEGDA